MIERETRIYIPGVVAAFVCLCDQVNSVRTVYANVYKIFLLQAYRWVPWPHGHATGPPRPPPSLGLAVCSALWGPRMEGCSICRVFTADLQLRVCARALHMVGGVRPVSRQQWATSVARVSPLLCTDQDPCRGLGHEAGAGSPHAEVESRHHRAQVPESR